MATIADIDGVEVPFLHLNQLIENNKAKKNKDHKRTNRPSITLQFKCLCLLKQNFKPLSLRQI